MHQIDSGLKRDYQENEIVDAVIRAISPHSSLRSYVETLSDLSLAKLRRILRVHYREKTASEVYQQDEREARAKNATTDGGQQLLLEIRQIKSEINDLKDQVNRRGSQAENSNWRGPSYRGRGRGYQPNRTSWGCQNCKQRGRGDECNHCFACGDSGHVARECYRNENRGSRQGNG